ncbi:MAG: thiamine phosphate synthase [Acidimicrobiales bacterium]
MPSPERRRRRRCPDSSCSPTTRWCRRDRRSSTPSPPRWPVGRAASCCARRICRAPSGPRWRRSWRRCWRLWLACCSWHRTPPSPPTGCTSPRATRCPPATGDRPWSAGRATPWRCAAAAAGCDYVTLSPVFASRSKPGYGPAVAVGQLGLAQASVPIPVVALGGIGPGEARALHAVGHRHAAVLGAVMEAADPAGTVADVLAALDGATLQEAT